VSSEVLTPAMLRVLEDLRSAEESGPLEDAELVCVGLECWRGDDKTSRATVDSLLKPALVSLSSVSSGAEVMTLADAGRAVLRRPALAGELAAALQQGAPFTIGPDDRLQTMAQKPAYIPAMLAGNHRRGSGSVYHAIPGPRDDNYWGRALCGAKPGGRSAGWAAFPDASVTCGKCLRKR
jgi:hypothetical protein